MEYKITIEMIVDLDDYSVPEEDDTLDEALSIVKDILKTDADLPDTPVKIRATNDRNEVREIIYKDHIL